MLKISLTAVFLFCQLNIVTSAAMGGSLNLVLQNPDIKVADMSVAYTYVDPFHATVQFNGSPEIFTPSPSDLSPVNIDTTQPRAFSLNAIVNPTTGALISGQLNVDAATVPTLGSTHLLGGTLTNFGFMPMINDDFDPTTVDSWTLLFEFTFNVTDGVLAGKYGSKGGVIFMANSEDYLNAFSNFTGSGFAPADVAMVPLPSSLHAGLALCFLLALFGKARRVYAMRTSV